MYENFIKRALDFIIALIAIIFISPLLIPICIGLLMSGEHHIFYFQKRLGYKNKHFLIWKFATMLKDSPNLAGGLHTIRKDPRILPMGGFLRKTKINELPQLVNILLGEMSIIGPRPLVDKTFAPYPDHIKELIYNIKPGLTGIGSIVFHDEEKLFCQPKVTPQEFHAKCIQPYKGELELWYQKHITFLTDIKIFFLTIWVIIAPENDLVYRFFKDLPPIPEFLIPSQDDQSMV